MVVAIPTYERTALLRKGVLPHVRAGASVRVYDASSSLVLNNENKVMLRSIEREFGISIPYASKREVKNYIKHLAKHGIDPDIAAYALLGNIGATRNQILLDNPGDLILMCDDDVVANFRVFGS